MQSLLQILKEVWRARVGSFLAVYVLITGTTAIAVAWVVGRRSVPLPERSRESAVPQTRRAWRPITSLATAILLGSILAGYLAIALKWEAFADYDDSYFTLYTLRGRTFGPPIWPDSGRFFPAGRSRIQLDTSFYKFSCGIPRRANCPASDCFLHSPVREQCIERESPRGHNSRLLNSLEHGLHLHRINIPRTQRDLLARLHAAIRHTLRSNSVYSMGGGCRNLGSDHDLLQGDSVSTTAGLCSRETHLTVPRRKWKGLGLGSIPRPEKPP